MVTCKDFKLNPIATASQLNHIEIALVRVWTGAINQIKSKPMSKTYYKTTEIAHAWAHQISPIGRCAAHMSFDGGMFNSYGTAIANIVRRGKRKAFVVDCASFSVTTSKHQNYVLRAIPEVEYIFRLHCGRRGQRLEFSAGELRDWYLNEYRRVETPSKFAWKRAEQFLGRMSNLERAIEVCKCFGLPTARLLKRRQMIQGDVENARRIVHEHVQKRIDATEAREAKRREAARVADAENIPKWLAGTRVSLSADCPVLLRATHSSVPEPDQPFDTMETSRGARVPLADAKRAFQFVIAARARGWHRNGERFEIGHYELDAVNEQGVVAGCHRVAWDEIERFAMSQGWI